MSKAARKVRDRRSEQARQKKFAGPTRVVRFERGAPVPSQEAEAFLIGAAPVLAELLAPAWDSDGLDHHALFVSDNSHDNGLSAIVDGRDPGHGSARWLSLTTAFNVAAFFSSEAEARPLLAPAPPRSVRMVVFVGGRVGVKVFEQAELRRALADAKRMAMHFVVEQPSEALFESLVDRDPQRLLRILSDSRMDPTLLTFAAEAAGRIRGPDTVTALLGLVNHPKAYVREGVAYALAQHLGDDRARTALRALAADASPGVGAAAAEQLAEAHWKERTSLRAKLLHVDAIARRARFSSLSEGSEFSLRVKVDELAGLVGAMGQEIDIEARLARGADMTILRGDLLGWRRLEPGGVSAWREWIRDKMISVEEWEDRRREDHD